MFVKPCKGQGANDMKIIDRRQYSIYFLIALIVTGIVTPKGQAAGDIHLSMGQSVYVSIYSHVYSGVKARPFDLGAILSIRNTDLNQPITIVSAKYYDTDGMLLKEYLGESLPLKALASTRYIIKEDDKAGGSGANFIVQWKSDKKVTPPIIEAIMIGTHSGQGISFVARGQVIEEHR
jgi:Protein of unknown function (DUF3124)